MSDIICKHCGVIFEGQRLYCPECNAPTPEQKYLELIRKKKRFVWFFIVLVLFSLILMFWLPR